jgi:hypothetical protein
MLGIKIVHKILLIYFLFTSISLLLDPHQCSECDQYPGEPNQRESGSEHRLDHTVHVMKSTSSCLISI